MPRGRAPDALTSFWPGGAAGTAAPAALVRRFSSLIDHQLPEDASLAMRRCRVVVGGSGITISPVLPCPRATGVQATPSGEVSTS